MCGRCCIGFTYGESPHEEENSNEDDGQDGLLDSQGRGACQSLILHRLAVGMLDGFDVGRPALRSDVRWRWFLVSAEHDSGLGSGQRW